MARPQLPPTLLFLLFTLDTIRWPALVVYGFGTETPVTLEVWSSASRNPLR